MIPEVVLHRVLVRGLKAVREDPRIIDTLFKNLDQGTLQAMKDFMLRESIHLTINYPRAEALHTPTVAMLLKGESESQTFIGDIMGAWPNYEMPDQDLHIDTLGGHGASVSSLSGLPRKLIGPLTVVSASYDEDSDLTTVVISEDHQEDMISLLSTPVPCGDLYSVSGAGAGQVGRIINFRVNSLDIVGEFDPQLDDTSLVDVRLATDTGLAIGEPSRVFEENAPTWRKGANYQAQYQLSIIASHQDETLYLYSIIKAILFSQKIFMEEQGIQALQITGSDFSPRTEYLPNEVFQRVMNLTFVYPFTYVEEMEVFTDIRFSLTPVDPSTHDRGEAMTFDIIID